MNDWQELWLRALKLRDQISIRRKLPNPSFDSDEINNRNGETSAEDSENTEFEEDIAVAK